ncbi:MAG: hypothetical protein WAL71_15900 [Terriglobales bacterium]
MLPILIVLFVISYAILTLLVVEQGRVIESQRSLIREMLKDSNQLAALKGKMARDESLHSRQKSRAGEGASGPAEQQKDSTGGPKASGKNGKQPAKPEHNTKEAPGQPESDLQDVRRMNSIL